MTAINRRKALTVVASIPAAAAVAATPALGLAKGAELHKLIEDHRAAYNAFVVELEKDDDTRPEVDAAHDVEIATRSALIEYRCQTVDEAGTKARYLLTTGHVKDWWDSEAQAFLASFG
jgi:hypothetical protein